MVISDGDGFGSTRAANSAALHFESAGWISLKKTPDEFVAGDDRFQGLILAGHGDETTSGSIDISVLKNKLDRSGDKLSVVMALSCHGVDFVSTLTPKYTTADALIISYRGYNYNDGPQSYRVGRSIDRWLKNPTYTFESHGKLIADGFGIVGVPLYRGVLSGLSSIAGFFGF